MDLQLPANQQHLLAHVNQLSDTERQSLTQQLEAIDFDLMEKLFAGDDKQTDWAQLAAKADSPPAFRLATPENKIADCEHSASAATTAGKAALTQGQLGVILVAGGQGTRLGFEHPKGMFPVGPLSNRTLFQIHIEQIRAVAQTYGVSIPLYLMTSPATHQDTVDFLEANNRFGMPASDLHVFCQGTLPAVDAETGELLLESPASVFQSPDGHGGTLQALDKNGCLADMDKRGITQLYYFQVDNPLVEICQPELVGYHLLSESELTTQVVGKNDPMEKVGNVVSVDGKMMVIEYSDLPVEFADRRDAKENPIFWAGSIAVHVFAVDFLKRVAADSESLPFHRANKKVPYINAAGERIEPQAPNAIKFEKFIFDLMPAAQNPIVVEASASNIFAPLKNASGAPKDTPEATRAAISNKHKRMLEAAGATVKEGVQVEINPLFALDAEQLKAKIADTLVVDGDQYFEG